MYIIYKISYKERIIYIGSTKDFHKRICAHKTRCYENSEKSNYAIYQFIRENCEWQDLSFEVLEEIEDYNDKKEIREVEGDYIRLYRDSCLNIEIPGRTKKEWIKDNIDKFKQTQKKYKQSDKGRKYQNKYNNTDERKQYMKDYSQTDKRKAYMKAYYQRNKSINEIPSCPIKLLPST